MSELVPSNLISRLVVGFAHRCSHPLSSIRALAGAQGVDGPSLGQGGCLTPFQKGTLESIPCTVEGTRIGLPTSIVAEGAVVAAHLEIQGPHDVNETNL